VQEFNKGVYDYIIATDESGVGQEHDNEEEEGEEEQEEENEEECNLTFKFSKLLSF
jgi:ATP-dependent RNA helicase DDX56/DBP9